MYLPSHFEEHDPAKIHALVRRSPLGTLVVQTNEGLVANHIPFLLAADQAPTVSLQAHIPKANPLSVALLEKAHDCLVIFHGPEGYISPSGYATKKEHGRVVPTWNYAVVHVHGTIRAIDDPSWVLSQVIALTAQNEAARTEPWAVSDAPKAFTGQLARTLVGLEVTVESMIGKTKASQNQPRVNQTSLLRTMAIEQPESSLTALMRETLAGEDT